MQDIEGRAYQKLTPVDERRLGLSPGRQFWWCALPLRRYRGEHYGDIPRPGWIVGPYAVQRVVLGFVRGRTVGVVELR